MPSSDSCAALKFVLLADLKQPPQHCTAPCNVEKLMLATLVIKYKLTCSLAQPLRTRGVSMPSDRVCMHFDMQGTSALACEVEKWRCAELHAYAEAHVPRGSDRIGRILLYLDSEGKIPLDMLSKHMK